MINADESNVIKLTINYIRESEQAKRDRMDKNKVNFDTYHLRQDYSHKRPGQSREFIPKQAMAVEQITSFFQQGLIDIDEWFKITPSPGVVNPMITENEATLLLQNQLNKAGFYSVVGDAIKLGLLGSLMIFKVHGRYKKVPTYRATDKFDGQKYKKILTRADKKQWELVVDLIRQEDFHIDINAGFRGKPLYRAQINYLDMYELYALSEGDHPIYDRAKVETLASQVADEEVQKLAKARETGNNSATINYRNRVKITEVWGDLIDSVTGKMIQENVTWTLANDRVLIQEPTENPFWHGEDPFITAPILRVPFATWHKALMDAPTKLNIAQNELFNLTVDAGMMATHGIKQIRNDWLEDPAQVENGIQPGMTIGANTQCPPGMKVLERVDTSSMSSETMATYNLINSEFMQGALTNDLRMGTMPTRAVKATEVVEASQTITSIFNGVVKNIEEEAIAPVLDKAWRVCLQNMDDISAQETQDLIGQDRALAVGSVSAEERFAQEATGKKFTVFGVSSILGKMQDFRKLTSFMQTVFGTEILTEEFMKKYSPAKLLGEIMRSLNINISRLEIGEEEKAAIMAAQMQAAQQTPGQGAAVQSQTPQASAGPAVQTAVPMTNFPRTSGGIGGAR